MIERLKETATRLRMGDDRASAEQRAERLTLLASSFIEKCEDMYAAAPGAPLPHGGSYPGFAVKMEVMLMHAVARTGQHDKVTVEVHSNVPVRALPRLRRSRAGSQPRQAALLWAGAQARPQAPPRGFARAAGAEEDQSFTVQAVLGLRKTDDIPSPAENSPRALLASRPGAYDVLLELVDRSSSARVRENAQVILQMLPTRDSVRDELRRLLEATAADPATAAADARGRLRELLGLGPAELVYALQVLDGLLSSAPKVGYAGGDDGSSSPGPGPSSVAALRGSFLALGCARDILTTLPSGITGEDDDTGAAAVGGEVGGAGLAAWRDAALRRALCTAALSLLRILLRGVGVDDSEPSESLGSLGGAIGTMGLREERDERMAADGDDPGMTVSDDDATGSRRRLAKDAITALANLAYIMGTGIRVGDPSEKGSDVDDATRDAMDSDARLDSDARSEDPECDSDDEDGLTRDDWRLSRDSLALLATCTQLCASGESHPADSVMAMPVFPAMLRDMLIRSPHGAIRLNTAEALYQLAVRGGKGDKKDGGKEDEKEVSPGMVTALLSVRSLAIEHPSQCEQYHLLLCKMLSFHDDASTIEELLREEVEALRVTPPATEETEAMLKSRLILIRTLIERLEKVGRGSKAAGRGLVQVLLFRCLFPEAVPMLRPSAEVLKLAGMPPPIVHGGEIDPTARTPRRRRRGALSASRTTRNSPTSTTATTARSRRTTTPTRSARMSRPTATSSREDPSPRAASRPSSTRGRTSSTARRWRCWTSTCRRCALRRRRGPPRFDSSPISVRTTPKTWWR